MKKILYILLILLVFIALPVRAEEPGSPQAAVSQRDEVVTRTYTLKHIDPLRVKETLNVYFYNISFSQESSVITVRLPKANLAPFEEELRKLDAPRRSILLRVFTIIAAKTGKGEDIENKDLKRVLAEISNLLNFKAYTLDGASVIALRDGTRYGELLLSSDSLEGLRLEFKHVALATNADGKRAVRLGFQLLQHGGMGVLLYTETEVAENGYLVAGVSRIGNGGKSLVLVINAEIK